MRLGLHGHKAYINLAPPVLVFLWQRQQAHTQHRRDSRKSTTTPPITALIMMILSMLSSSVEVGCTVEKRIEEKKHFG